MFVQRRHLGSSSWSSGVYNHWTHSLHRLATQERYLYKMFKFYNEFLSHCYMFTVSIMKLSYLKYFFVS